MSIIRRPGLVVGGIIVIVLLALTALAEFSMGRILICKCGDVLAWYPYTNGPGNSQHLLDWYSFTHVIHGFLIYALLRVFARKLPVQTRLILTVLLEGAWEIFENTDFTINRYRAATIALDYYGDSIINSLSDVVFCVAGFILAWKLPTKISIGVVLGIEILLAYFVHDNLSLNIVMLIYPLDGIMNWQASPSPIPPSPV